MRLSGAPTLQAHHILAATDRPPAPKRVLPLLLATTHRRPVTMASAMDKTLFNMRFTSKQLLRESKKAESKSKDEVRATVCNARAPATRAL